MCIVGIGNSLKVRLAGCSDKKMVVFCAICGYNKNIREVLLQWTIQNERGPALVDD